MKSILIKILPKLQMTLVYVKKTISQDIFSPVPMLIYVFCMVIEVFVVVKFNYSWKVDIYVFTLKF